MKIIAAVDKNFAIGKDNGLLASIPADMKFFRETTSGHTIVMGSKTYLSFPKRPLPNRTNIVISHSPENYSEVTAFGSIEDFLAYAKTATDDIYVCGGAMVYKELLPYCTHALITKIDQVFDGDAFFPNIDEMPEWELISESETVETGGYNIKFTTYENKEPKAY